MIFNSIPKIGERVEIASRFVPIADNLLDVGCGNGLLKHFINDKVKEIYGIDNDKKVLEESKKKGIFTKQINLDKDSFPFKNNFFDVVTCLDVVEHVKDPNVLFKEIYRVLKSNGLLIISTPNIRFSDHIFKLLFKGVFPKTSDDNNIYDGGHVHFFTYADVCNILKKIKFKIERVEGIINKEKRGWKGRLLERILGKKFMLEFRAPGILIIAKK